MRLGFTYVISISPGEERLNNSRHVCLPARIRGANICIAADERLKKARFNGEQSNGYMVSLELKLGRASRRMYEISHKSRLT